MAEAFQNSLDRSARGMARAATAAFPISPNSLSSRPPFAPAAPIARALQLISDRLPGKLLTERLAREVGLSRTHFARRFRAEIGMSAQAYLTRLRIDQAKLLLVTTRRSLVDIAIDLGFCSQSHFTNVFRRHVGNTPQRFRDRSLAGR